MPISSKKIKLKMVLENNRAWPLILVGASADDFHGAVMPASLSERDLNIGGWGLELRQMAAGIDQLYLIINGLDARPSRDQLKFERLVKDRRGGDAKLPENVQIIIPVKSADRLAQSIKDLCLIYNA